MLLAIVSLLLILLNLGNLLLLNFSVGIPIGKAAPSLLVPWVVSPYLFIAIRALFSSNCEIRRAVENLNLGLKVCVFRITVPVFFLATFTLIVYVVSFA